MCDEGLLRKWGREAMSRRRFGQVAAASGLAFGAAGCATMAAPGQTERTVSFATPDGTLDGWFVAPSGTKRPGVIFWPDIAGLRPAKKAMASRLAAAGHAVLVVNPYYRDVTGQQFEDFAEFAANDGFQKVRPWREKLTADAIMRDAKAAIAWLDAQDEVDTSRGVGTQGYCMGGPFTFWTAAAVPARVKAAASFHGGGLVRDGANSPHRLADDSQARYLVATAQDDDAENPQATATLRETFAAIDNPAEIEVYAGDHGWTVPDSPAYAPEAAERAWERLQ
ncbi:MAG: dienelactone hydrolase family protein, partial [Erythrobacter sp.]|nr:dienelactone hydrolase family protein [Erythrobacter sp.]